MTRPKVKGQKAGKPPKVPKVNTRAKYNWVSIILWVVGTIVLAFAGWYWYSYGRAATYQYEVDSIPGAFTVPIAGISFAASIMAYAVVYTIVGIVLLISGWYLNRRFPGGNFHARVAKR